MGDYQLCVLIMVEGCIPRYSAGMGGIAKQKSGTQPGTGLVRKSIDM